MPPLAFKKVLADATDAQRHDTGFGRFAGHSGEQGSAQLLVRLEGCARLLGRARIEPVSGKVPRNRQRFRG